MIEMSLIFFLLAIPLLVAAVLFSVNREDEDRSLRQALNEGEGREVFITPFERSFLVVDYNRNKIEVGSNKIVKNTGKYIDPHHWSFEFSQLRSVETVFDETTVSKTDRGSQLVGGAVGLAALGGVGAIIGGLSAQKYTAEKLRSVSLLMRFDDRTNPLYRLMFFKATDEVNGDAPSRAELFLGDLQRLEALLANILADGASQPKATNSKEGLADTLSQLFELHQSGALTDEEFAIAKKSALERY